MLGTAASILGALAIGATGLLLIADVRVMFLGLIGGVIGVMIDSLLGARWQAMYYCPACEVETESHPNHHCGAASRYHRGWLWLKNDAVNLLATMVGSCVCVLMANFWL
jgi:uncharacterized membrane protein